MKKNLELPLLGGLCLLLGFVVLLGWYLHLPILIQVLPHFAPMQYNTALGFLLSGVGLLCLKRADKITAVFGLLVLLNGFLVLVQYIFHTNLGIDQLFMQHYIDTYTSYPGRMAPNTALCFSMTGAALILYGLREKFLFARLISAVFISIVGVLGCFSILGYIISLKAIYGWGNLTGMAVHTAIGFILIAAASFRPLCAPYLKENYKTSFMASISVCTFGFVVFLLSWQALVTSGDTRIKQAISRDANFVKNKIILSLSSRVYPIERLFYRIDQLQTSNLSLIQRDIQNYFADSKNLLVVSFQPTDGKPLRFISNKINDKEALRDINLCLEHAKTVERSPLKTEVSTDGELLCITNHHLNKVAIFSIHSILDNLLKSADLDSYGASLESNKQNYYLKQISVSKFFKQQWQATETFKFLKREWTLTLWISEKTVREKTSFFPIAFLAFGLLLTLLLSAMVRLWQNSMLKNILLAEATNKIKQGNEELKRSNEELNDFAYIASHDLKEPLRGINNFSTFLSEDYSDKLDDEGKQQIKTIQNLCQRMEKLIDNLLNYSRVGRLELSLGECDLNEIIEDKKKLLEHFLTENQAKIIIKHPLPTLFCDKARIGEIFQNLITNAVKYNDNKIKNIEINFEDHAEEYLFSIKDNGIGIAAENQQKVFQMFKRLHGRNEYGGGTGAGMTITQKIIARHNGRIWLQSKPGEGSTFYFTISKTIKAIHDSEE